jgi:hypothetical protein
MTIPLGLSLLSFYLKTMVPKYSAVKSSPFINWVGFIPYSSFFMFKLDVHATFIPYYFSNKAKYRE